MIDKFESYDFEQVDEEKQIKDDLTKECKKLVLLIQSADIAKKKELEEALFAKPRASFDMSEVFFRAAFEGLTDDRMNYLDGEIIKVASTEDHPRPSDAEVVYRVSLLSEEDQLRLDLLFREWQKHH